MNSVQHQTGLLKKSCCLKHFFPCRSALFEEKRRLEGRITQLEEELEEEQSNAECGMGDEFCSLCPSGEELLK